MNKRKKYYTIGLIVGLIFLYFEILIFRKTFIGAKEVILAILVIGFTASILELKTYKSTYPETRFPKLFCFLNSSIMWGGTIVSLTIILNYYFKSSEYHNKTFNIESVSLVNNKYGNDSPAFTVNYKGVNKEIIFNNDYYAKRYSFNEIELQIHSGLFGLEVFSAKSIN